MHFLTTCLYRRWNTCTAGGERVAEHRAGARPFRVRHSCVAALYSINRHTTLPHTKLTRSLRISGGRRAAEHRAGAGTVCLEHRGAGGAAALGVNAAVVVALPPVQMGIQVRCVCLYVRISELKCRKCRPSRYTALMRRGPMCAWVSMSTVLVESRPHATRTEQLLSNCICVHMLSHYGLLGGRHMLATQSIHAAACKGQTSANYTRSWQRHGVSLLLMHIGLDGHASCEGLRGTHDPASSCQLTGRGAPHFDAHIEALWSSRTNLVARPSRQHCPIAHLQKSRRITNFVSLLQAVALFAGTVHPVLRQVVLRWWCWLRRRSRWRCTTSACGSLPTFQFTIHHQLRPQDLGAYLCLCNRRALAVFCAALSVAVVLAEATISPALPNLSLFSRGLHALQVSFGRPVGSLLRFNFAAKCPGW